MQLFSLPSNIYRLADYALNQARFEQYRKEFEEPVRRWKILKEQCVDEHIITKIVGISRAKYYRLRKKLAEKIDGFG